jgi:crotonobetainyl-CoA:carnitine CoA-transferase CaiB-like acyl-CoA transferase
MSGYQAVIGILSAVIARRWLGEGQKVEVSMLATVMECEIQELTTHLVSGQLPTRSAEPSAHGWIGAPYGIYETADGHIVLAYVPLGELAEVIGCSELLKYSSIDDGFTHRDEMSRLVAEALRKRPTSEWLDEMLPRGFMAGPVYTYADLVNDPHVSATGMIAEVENPGGGTYRTPSPPIRLSKTPLRISRRPPKLGEHTTEVVASIATAPPEKLSSAGDSSNS